MSLPFPDVQGHGHVSLKCWLRDHAQLCSALVSPTSGSSATTATWKPIAFLADRPHVLITHSANHLISSSCPQLKMKMRQYEPCTVFTRLSNYHLAATFSRHPAKKN